MENTEKINASWQTRGIKNCRGSWLFNGCSPLQLLYNLIGNRPQSATFHTANVIGVQLSAQATLGLDRKSHATHLRKLRQTVRLYFRRQKIKHIIVF
jgi:hypothetical protein